MDLDLKSSIGNLIPDVSISRIILESAAQEVFKDNPHIEAEGDVKIPYKTKNSNPLKVTLDIMMRDIIEGDLISTWATNFDFNQYLKAVVIQVRDEDASAELHQARATSKKSFVLKVYELKVQNTLTPQDYQLFSLRQDELAEDATKILNKAKSINSNGQEFFEFGFTTTFAGIPDDNPPFLEYFAYTYLDLDQLSNDFDFDLNSWGVDVNNIPDKFVNEGTGEIKSAMIFKDGVSPNAAKYYTTSNGDLWAGAIYFLDDGTPSGTQPPKNPIPLTEYTIPNTKIQDFRARDTFFQTPVDMSFVDQKFFAPMAKMKTAGTETLWPDIAPAFFSDLLAAKDHNGNARLFFSVDMETVFRYHSKFGSFTNAYIGNPLKEMLDLSEIKGIKIFKREVEPGNSIEATYGGKTHYVSKNPDAAPALVAFGSRRVSTNQIEFIDLEESKLQKKFIYVGKEETQLSLKNKNVRHFSLTDFAKYDNPNYARTYQYSMEFEFNDGGFEYFSQLYQDMLFEFNFIDRYSLRAQVPRAFEYETNKFSTKFKNENANIYDDHITTLIGLLIKLATAVASSGPENNTFDYGALATLLANYTSPNSGTISGIEILKTMTIEAIFNLERILDINSSKPKPSNQNQESPKGKTAQRRPKLTYEFGTLFKDSYSNLGYDFISSTKEDTVQDSSAGLKVIDLNKFETRAILEAEKYFNDLESPIELTIMGSKALATTSKMQYAYFTPSLAFINKKSPESFIGQDPAQFEDKKFLKASIDIILNNVIKAPTLEETQEKLELLFARKGGMVISTVVNENLAMNGMIKEGSPLPNDVNKDADDGTSDLNDAVNFKPAPNGAGINEGALFKNDPPKNKPKKPKKKGVGLMAGLQVGTVFPPPIGNKLKLSPIPGFSFPLDNYEVKSPNNVFAKLGLSKEGAKEKFKQLPNQIKALFVAGEEKDKGGISQLKFNPFSKGNPLYGPSRSYMFFFNYQNIAVVEVLDGYETSSDGKNRNFLSKPKFKLLTEEVYNSIKGKAVLCRVRRYMDNNFIKPFNDFYLELPFYDEYFILKDAGKPIVKLDPPAPQVQGIVKQIAKAANNNIPLEVVHVGPQGAGIKNPPKESPPNNPPPAQDKPPNPPGAKPNRAGGGR